MNEAELLQELMPVAERLTARHYDTCKPWYPHEFVPWSLGRDFAEGEDWDAFEATLRQRGRARITVDAAVRLPDGTVATELFPSHEIVSGNTPSGGVATP